MLDDSLAKTMGLLPYTLEEGVAKAEHALDALAPGMDPDAASKLLDDGLDRLVSAARGVLR
jgi:hypothetical protein